MNRPNVKVRLRVSFAWSNSYSVNFIFTHPKKIPKKKRSDNETDSLSRWIDTPTGSSVGQLLAQRKVGVWVAAGRLADRQMAEGQAARQTNRRSE
jgi:hypothetical protein